MKLYTGPFKSVSRKELIEPNKTVDCTHTYALYPGPVITTSTIPGWIPGSWSEFSSLYAPKYWELIRDGWIIQCPFRKVVDVWSHSPSLVIDDVYVGTTFHGTHTYSNLCSYATAPYSFKPPRDFTSQRQAAFDEAVTRVFAKANTRNADLLIDLLEFKSTIDLFVKLGWRLVTLATTPGAILDLPGLLALISGRRSTRDRRVRAYPVTLDRWLHELAGLWCEMRFGWRPLLSTLEGVITSLSDPNLGKEKRITYRASENVELQDIQTNTRYDSAGGTTSSPAYFTTETRYEGRFRAGILLAERYDLAESLGLSVDFVPIAVWDLIPLSFIVDRFVNVGNFIRSLRPIASTDFGGAWCVERFKLSYVFRGEYLATDQTSGSGDQQIRWIRTGGTDGARFDQEGTIRTIVQSPPSLPTVRWDWSSINNLFNAVDGVMLAIQRLIPMLSRTHRR